LKVLIAGDSGIGKTSLIKAIVQSCKHIVHVDPIAPSPVSLPQRSPTNAPARHGTRRRHNSRIDMGTSHITEVYASTKPYPEWWSELDDSRILRRRKSIDEAVLDRNICFVDTPGYSSASSVSDYCLPD
jgi:GTPase SAR1 family protein